MLPVTCPKGEDNHFPFLLFMKKANKTKIPIRPKKIPEVEQLHRFCRDLDETLEKFQTEYLITNTSVMGAVRMQLFKLVLESHFIFRYPLSTCNHATIAEVENDKEFGNNVTVKLALPKNPTPAEMLGRKIHLLIEKYKAEYDLGYASMMGALEHKLFRLCEMRSGFWQLPMGVMLAVENDPTLEEDPDEEVSPEYSDTLPDAFLKPDIDDEIDSVLSKFQNQYNIDNYALLGLFYSRMVGFANRIYLSNTSSADESDEES